MNHYEAKQQARRDRLEQAADRAEARANSQYKRADLREEVSGIPLGQPILVGHHSEGRHRRAIAKADSAMRASIEANKRAKDLRGRAASVGTGGISSDDPDAVLKLKKKLQAAETKQAFMKAANKVIRAAHKAGVDCEDHPGLAGYLEKLRAIPGGENCTAKTAVDLVRPYLGSIGFPRYELTNNNANIRRMKKRIEQLEAASAAETKRQVFQGVCELLENVEENRLQFIFEGKPPAAIRTALKSAGFRWAPSQGAWQRQLTNGARYSAQQVLSALGLAT